MKWTPNRYRSDLWLRVRQVDGGSPMTCWKCHSGNCQRPWSQQLFWVLKASGSAWPGCAVELAGNLRSRDLRTLTGVMIFFSCCQYAVPKSPKKNLRAHCPGAPARSEAYLERDEVTGAQRRWGWGHCLWDLDNKKMRFEPSKILFESSKMEK
jgi:hypothetical protein